jgi:hypothetical protein
MSSVAGVRDPGRVIGEAGLMEASYSSPVIGRILAIGRSGVLAFQRTPERPYAATFVRMSHNAPAPDSYDFSLRVLAGTEYILLTDGLVRTTAGNP